MNATPYFARVFHQCRTEWRHQWGMVGLWVLLMLLRQCYRSYVAKSVFSMASIAGLDLWLEVAALLTVGLMTWRCVSADAPSNTDSFSLTRPVGQGGLWCGKLVFALGGVFLPAVIVSGSCWRGFGLGWGHWLALVAAVMVAAGLVCVLAGALTALAVSSRQAMAFALLALLGGGVCLAVWEQWMERDALTLEQRNVQQCGSAMAALFCLGGLLLSWWLSSVPRRRWMATGVMFGTLVISPMIGRTWRMDWITQPYQNYANEERLVVKVGKADPTDKPYGRALWPTLRIEGLGRDEVASIIEFAPLDENLLRPPQGSYSDFAFDAGGLDSWLHSGHTRALFKYSDSTTLWRQSIENSALYSGRKSLNEVLQTLRLKHEDAIMRPWRLQLAVHEMKRIVTVPYRQFWTQENCFLIRSGLRLEFNAYGWTRDVWEMYGRAHRVSSALLPTASYRSVHARGRDLCDDFFLVLEDRELRENRALSLGLVQRRGSFGLYRDMALPWQNDENQGFELRTWIPREQSVILGTTLDEWIDNQDATLWYAEDHGTVEIDLMPDQVAQIFGETKNGRTKP